MRLEKGEAGGARQEDRSEDDRDSVASDRRKVGELALSELSALCNEANLPLFGTDTEGKINVWNFKSAEVLEYTMEQATGRSLASMLSTVGP